MTTITVSAEVEVNLEDVLEEASPTALADALATHNRENALSAIQAAGLMKITEDCPEMDDLENLILAFKKGDRSLFEISLSNLFPAAKTQIAMDLCQPALFFVA